MLKNLLRKFIHEKLFNDGAYKKCIIIERGLFSYDKSNAPYLSYLMKKHTLFVADKNIHDRKIPKKIRYDLNQIKKYYEADKISAACKTQISKECCNFMKSLARKSKVNQDRMLFLAEKGKMRSYEFCINGKLASVFVWYMSSDTKYCRLIYNINDYGIIRGKYTGLVKYGYLHCISELQNQAVDSIDLGGISGLNNGIDKTKKIYSDTYRDYYNYYGLRIFGK